MADPVRSSRTHGAVLVFSSLAVLLGGTALSTPGVAVAQVQQGVLIGRIVLQGNERIDPETILS